MENSIQRFYFLPKSTDINKQNSTSICHSAFSVIICSVEYSRIKMHFFKFIVILAVTNVNLILAFNQRSTLISTLLKDIIQKEKVPSSILAVTCWSTTDLLHLVKTVMVPVQIVRFNDLLKLSDKENMNSQWNVIDMNCEQGNTFLSTVESKYFAHPYRWIIIDSTIKSIESLSILPDSNVILANTDTSEGEFSLNQGLI